MNETAFTEFLYWAGMIGVSVFAITGVLAAAGRRIDFFGVIVLGAVTALGGGTMRDVTLNIHPVTWIVEPSYMWVAILSSVCAFFWARYLRSPRRMLLLLDAMGLAVFSIVGMERALLAGAPELVAVVMAIMSGVAGGVVRDLLMGQVPLVFQRGGEMYATCSLLGALFYLGAQKIGLESNQLLMLLAILVVLATRLIALRAKISLPEFVARDTTYY